MSPAPPRSLPIASIDSPRARRRDIEARGAEAGGAPSVLLLPQRNHGIHQHGPASRGTAGGHCYDGEERCRFQRTPGAFQHADGAPNSGLGCRTYEPVNPAENHATERCSEPPLTENTTCGNSLPQKAAHEGDADSLIAARHAIASRRKAGIRVISEHRTQRWRWTAARATGAAAATAEHSLIKGAIPPRRTRGKRPHGSTRWP
jgi:hypothetical protein